MLVSNIGDFSKVHYTLAVNNHRLEVTRLVIEATIHEGTSKEG